MLPPPPRAPAEPKSPLELYLPPLSRNGAALESNTEGVLATSPSATVVAGCSHVFDGQSLAGAMQKQAVKGGARRRSRRPPPSPRTRAWADLETMRELMVLYIFRVTPQDASLHVNPQQSAAPCADSPSGRSAQQCVHALSTRPGRGTEKQAHHHYLRRGRAVLLQCCLWGLLGSVASHAHVPVSSVPNRSGFSVKDHVRTRLDGHLCHDSSEAAILHGGGRRRPSWIIMLRFN